MSGAAQVLPISSPNGAAPPVVKNFLPPKYKPPEKASNEPSSKDTLSPGGPSGPGEPPDDGKDKGVLSFLSSFFKSPNNLSAFETREKRLKLLFNFLVTPFSALSAISSVSTFVMKHFFDKENELLDKTTKAVNKIAYFINGFYGGVDNNCTNNLVGAVGYSLVSLASIIGNEENMYYLKGWGSATDQLPAMNEELGYNKGVQKIERFGIKEGKEKRFNRYKNYWDSIDKTFTGMGVVCKDIYNGLKDGIKEKFPNILKPFWDVFVNNKKPAERNLLTSSLGMYLGCGLGFFPKLRRIGSIIRDIFAFQADIGLFAKGFSSNKAGDKTGSNLKYTACGAVYGLGSIGDLIYRITQMEKLNLAAVGLDNAGFWFMNWANADDNREAREDAFMGDKKEGEPEITPSRNLDVKPILQRAN